MTISQYQAKGHTFRQAKVLSDMDSAPRGVVPAPDNKLSQRFKAVMEEPKRLSWEK